MRTFDLHLAKRGFPVSTVGGSPVHIIAVLPDSVGKYPVVAGVMRKDWEVITQFTKQGIARGAEEGSPNNLTMAEIHMTARELLSAIKKHSLCISKYHNLWLVHTSPVGNHSGEVCSGRAETLEEAVFICVSKIQGDDRGELKY